MRIYIPTRGRAGRAKTIALLVESGIKPTLFIEKQQENVYRLEYGNSVSYMILPESNMGITYVRNFMLNAMEGATWVLDDDITGFYIRKGTKMIKATAKEVLHGAENTFIACEVAQGALGYQQIEWSSTKEFGLNGYCDVAVWINPAKLHVEIIYDYAVEGKEDRDFTMQIIRSGGTTCRHSIYCFAAPANGSNEGGLKDIFYDLKGREEKCADAMVKKWPWCVEKITKPNGRIDAKIDWKKINLKQDTLW